MPFFLQRFMFFVDGTKILPYEGMGETGHLGDDKPQSDEEGESLAGLHHSIPGFPRRRYQQQK